jgi:hypothetical protein
MRRTSCVAKNPAGEAQHWKDKIVFMRANARTNMFMLMRAIARINTILSFWDWALAPMN